jgi:alpha-ketoglutarate-dependent taurine dioxygenase
VKSWGKLANMPMETVTDRRAWTASTIDSPTAWYFPLPDACWNVWQRLQRDRPSGQLITAVSLADAERRACREALQPVRAALEAARGFAIVEGPPLPGKDAQLLYWVVGHGLGEPVEQNVEGTLLYDVRDTGRELAQGARVSVTNYESSFHTDNSFGDQVVDYVGLLCLQTAKAGGKSQVLSGYAVFNELQKSQPEILATLEQPFHIDRRGGIRAGEAPTIAYPVVSWKDRALTIRYLRYWIEVGHEKIGWPLTVAQRTALDVLDEVLRRPSLRIEFELKPGDMYFINNRWILHNRTAFEDHPEPNRRRHLVRLWLRA